MGSLVIDSKDVNHHCLMLEEKDMSEYKDLLKDKKKDYISLDNDSSVESAKSKEKKRLRSIITITSQFPIMIIVYLFISIMDFNSRGNIYGGIDTLGRVFAESGIVISPVGFALLCLWGTAISLCTLNLIYSRYLIINGNSIGENYHKLYRIYKMEE